MNSVSKAKKAEYNRVAYLKRKAKEEPQSVISDSEDNVRSPKKELVPPVPTSTMNEMEISPQQWEEFQVYLKSKKKENPESWNYTGALKSLGVLLFPVLLKGIQGAAVGAMEDMRTKNTDVKSANGSSQQGPSVDISSVAFGPSQSLMP